MGREDRVIARIDAGAGAYHRLDHRDDARIVPRRLEDGPVQVEPRMPGKHLAQRRHELRRPHHGPRVRRAQAVRRAFDDHELDVGPHALQLLHPERQRVEAPDDRERRNAYRPRLLRAHEDLGHRHGGGADRGASGFLARPDGAGGARTRDAVLLRPRQDLLRLRPLCRAQNTAARNERRGEKPLGMKRCQVRRDEGAQTETHDVDLFDAEVVEQPHDVARHLAAVGPDIRRLAALPVPAQIQRNDAMRPRKLLGDAAVGPHLERGAAAVNEEHRLSEAVFHVADRHAVRVEVPVLGRCPERQRQEAEQGYPRVSFQRRHDELLDVRAAEHGATVVKLPRPDVKFHDGWPSCRITAVAK